ncbi:MAG: hypothetical protein GWN71_16145 [Gammaproteobacteria bacterium]|nr:hypothetical protein [Gemmatimonadota bacterium]NIU75051.1 hypothetical protein [Gammaproteobacteria bacterium]NIY09138.1 hypothetical protein [Gemmatimonadota bacterium]
MGLTLDPEHRMLWAATTGAEPFRGLEADDEGRAALVVYDADSGTPLGRHAPPGGGPHFLGDIALGPDGTVYASNGLDGTVYALDPGAPPDAPLRRLLPAGTLASAQGIAPARDALFVADYSKGIFRVSPATGTAVRLPAPPVTALLGIDGLVPFQGDLIAIQNGTRPNRILRLHLERDGRAIAEVEVLAAALPEWAEPTQGTVVDGRFHFVANSQWPAFQDGAPDPAELDPPRIMWLDPGR